LQRNNSYTIDLTKIKGNGEFECPKCKAKISPDDETEDVYTILETVLKGEYLEKVVVQCNSCGSRIHITGFDLLNKIN
jgi:predicted nucleic-acid-binding Zn-ribbon protein